MKHIMQDIQDDICCMWVCTILLEKCVCIPFNQNDLILQLLQVPLVCYGAFHIDWFSKLLLTNYTLCGTSHKIE